MSEPDVIGDDRARGRGVTTVVALVVLALVAALAVNSLRHKGSSGAAAPPSSSAPPGIAPTPTPVPFTGPDVVLRVGDDVYEAVDNLLIHRDQLPAGATDVWATTLATNPSNAAANSRVIHVFGLADGVAFKQDIGSTSTGISELGQASDVLQTQEYPVLVHDGDPVTVGTPGARVSLPAGWQPGRFENLGYAGLIVKPVDQVGNVEIASWSPSGTPQTLTKAGRVLDITDGGQAIWLDPSCPDGPRCALYFGDAGGLHPPYGLQAPSGTEFTPEPAALGGGGYLAAVAERNWPSGSASRLVLAVVEPWRATAVIMPGTEGVVSSAGMFWVDGKHLVFVGGADPQHPRLMLYDVDANVAQPFGPTLPDGVRLLTAFGSTGGVSVMP
jgi:hypothetical protein